MPIKYLTYTSNLDEHHDREVFKTLMDLWNKNVSDLGVKSVSISSEDVPDINMAELQNILSGLVNLRDKLSAKQQDEITQSVNRLNNWILNAKNNFNKSDWNLAGD
jgi:hypothetical protein